MRANPRPALLLLALSVAGHGQGSAPFVRSPVLVQRSVGQVFALDGAQDLTVALFTRFTGAAAIWASTSDGRGVEWSTPLQLNDGTSGQIFTESDGVHIAGDDVYAVYRQSANPSFLWELYFVRSEDRGRSWSLPLRLDKGYPPGVGQVRSLRLFVSPDPAGDHVYVLSRPTLEPTSANVVGEEDLFLIASHDGGRSFDAPVGVSSVNGSGSDVDAFGLTARGRELHVAWVDDREDRVGQNNDVYQRSSQDGGATWLAAEQRVNTSLPGSSDTTAVEVEWDGASLVLAWLEDRTRSGVCELRTARSAAALGQAAGAPTFAPDELLGQYVPGMQGVSSFDLHQQTGVFLVLWNDTRPGAGLHCARSLDGGVSWGDDVPLLTTQVSPLFRASLAGAGQDVAVVAGGPFSTSVHGALSRDLGASFGPEVLLASPCLLRWTPRIAFNERYRSVQHLWTDAPGGGDDDLFTNGYRPQTLVPEGFRAGKTTVSFGLFGFEGAFPTILILASQERGHLSLPEDGRILGIAPGPLLGLTLGQPLGPLQTSVDPLGTGSSVPICVFLGPAQTFYFVAVSRDPNHNTFGQITDVVAVTIPSDADG